MGSSDLHPTTTRWWTPTLWPAVVVAVVLVSAPPPWAIPGLMVPTLEYGQSQAFQTADLVFWHGVWLGGFGLTVALGAARYGRTGEPRQPLRMRSVRDLAAAWPVGVLIFGILALIMDVAGLWRFTYLGAPQSRPQPPDYLDLRNLGRYPVGPLVGLVAGFVLAVPALRRVPSIASRLALGGSALFILALIQDHIVWPALSPGGRHASSAFMMLQCSGRVFALLAGAYVVLWAWAARMRQAELARADRHKGSDAASTDDSILSYLSIRPATVIPAIAAGLLGRYAIVAGAHGVSYLDYLLGAVDLWAECVAVILGLTCRNKNAFRRTVSGALLLSITVGIATWIPMWPLPSTGLLDYPFAILFTAVILLPGLAIGLGVGWVWRGCRRLCSRSREHAVEL